MKQFTINAAVLDKFNERGYIHFQCDGCNVFIHKLQRLIMKDNLTRASWYVLLERNAGEGVYIECFFDECYDYKNRRKKIYNTSRKGNPYIGFCYCPPKDPLTGADNPNCSHFEKWKRNPTWRYPRLQECLRLMTGIFTDCGVDVKDIAEGRVKYDDLIDYVKAWVKNTVVGHPYVLPESIDLDFLQDYKEEPNEFDDMFDSMFDDSEDDLPWA